jgi:hypothetical protein
LVETIAGPEFVPGAGGRSSRFFNPYTPCIPTPPLITVLLPPLPNLIVLIESPGFMPGVLCTVAMGPSMLTELDIVVAVFEVRPEPRPPVAIEPPPTLSTAGGIIWSG